MISDKFRIKEEISEDAFDFIQRKDVPTSLERRLDWTRIEKEEQEWVLSQKNALGLTMVDIAAVHVHRPLKVDLMQNIVQPNLETLSPLFKKIPLDVVEHLSTFLPMYSYASTDKGKSLMKKAFKKLEREHFSKEDRKQRRLLLQAPVVS